MLTKASRAGLALFQWLAEHLELPQCLPTLPTMTLVQKPRMARARGSVQKPPGGPYAQQCKLGYCARSFNASSAQQAPRLCPVSTSRQPCRRCKCENWEPRVQKRPGCVQAPARTLPELQEQMLLTAHEQARSCRASCLPQAPPLRLVSSSCRPCRGGSTALDCKHGTMLPT